MGLVLIVTHPHSDVCGEITHWNRTVVAKIENERALEAYTENSFSVWKVVRQYGSYQRAVGSPFFPIWLGQHGGMGVTPETSPTADFVWEDEVPAETDREMKSGL